MSQHDDLLKALDLFRAQTQHCQMELSREINISELKVKQLRYLEIIGRHQHLSFSQLADILDVTKPSVTGIVNQLLRLGVVTKERCDLDGRVHYVVLSDKGRQIVKFQELKQERLAKHIETLLSPDEVRTLIELVQKISKT